MVGVFHDLAADDCAFDVRVLRRDLNRFGAERVLLLVLLAVKLLEVVGLPAPLLGTVLQALVLRINLVVFLENIELACLSRPHRLQVLFQVRVPTFVVSTRAHRREIVDIGLLAVRVREK